MGTFYDIFIKMIDYYDQTFLFVDGPSTATDDEDLNQTKGVGRKGKNTLAQIIDPNKNPKI